MELDVLKTPFWRKLAGLLVRWACLILSSHPRWSGPAPMPSGFGQFPDHWAPWSVSCKGGAKILWQDMQDWLIPDCLPLARSMLELLWVMVEKTVKRHVLCLQTSHWNPRRIWYVSADLWGERADLLMLFAWASDLQERILTPWFRMAHEHPKFQYWKLMLILTTDSLKALAFSASLYTVHRSVSINEWIGCRTVEIHEDCGWSHRAILRTVAMWETDDRNPLVNWWETDDLLPLMCLILESF